MSIGMIRFGSRCQFEYPNGILIIVAGIVDPSESYPEIGIDRVKCDCLAIGLDCKGIRSLCQRNDGSIGLTENFPISGAQWVQSNCCLAFGNCLLDQGCNILPVGITNLSGLLCFGSLWSLSTCGPLGNGVSQSQVHPGKCRVITVDPGIKVNCFAHSIVCFCAIIGDQIVKCFFEFVFGNKSAGSLVKEKSDKDHDRDSD